MRVFYAHPMKRYGTEIEKKEVALIEERFKGWEVVNPRAEPGKEPEYYLGLVASCDSLVFSRQFGYLTEGVRPEVEFAISKGKPVYELREGRFVLVGGPVGNRPLLERLALRARAALGIGS